MVFFALLYKINHIYQKKDKLTLWFIIMQLNAILGPNFTLLPTKLRLRTDTIPNQIEGQPGQVMGTLAPSAVSNSYHSSPSPPSHQNYI
jgi:hypothetical protein